MRIVYCINRIRHAGGLQRVIVAKANALAEIEGNEIYIIVTDHKRGTDVAELSPKVRLIDLDVNYYDSYRENVITGIIAHKRKKTLHRKALIPVLHEINPDIVISTRCFEKQILVGMKDRSWKTVLEYHFRKNNTSVKGLLDAYYYLAQKYDDYFVERKYDRIVVLTQYDKDSNWQGWENVSVMPNPISFQCEEPSPLTEQSICSMGRLVPNKNFTGLINVFEMVLQRHPNWSLKIYGEGPEKKRLQQLIEQKNLQDKVYLCGVTQDVEGVLKQSSMFAFTSLEEGFGLVLIEAMECGVPVVSYDCPCGPREIIDDGMDGFLVNLNDEKMMADRICALIENTEMCRKMGVAARKKAQLYHIDPIIGKWMEFFKGLQVS